MAYKISDACIACGACVDTCPVSAISEDGEKYKIAADKCTDCGACAGNCPVEAISRRVVDEGFGLSHRRASSSVRP